MNAWNQSLARNTVRPPSTRFNCFRLRDTLGVTPENLFEMIETPSAKRNQCLGGLNVL